MKFLKHALAIVAVTAAVVGCVTALAEIRPDTGTTAFWIGTMSPQDEAPFVFPILFTSEDECWSRLKKAKEALGTMFKIPAQDQCTFVQIITKDLKAYLSN
nr:hypothetical protein [Burkholderia ambifaria]